jgi:prepilin-type N-terminal cleavage/methylation domain-containing protein
MHAPADPGPRRRLRRGVTLLELLLAVGIFAFLAVAVFQILDRSLSLWRRAETRRSLLAQASTVSDLIAHDLAGLEGGARGDLVAEWVTFDTDGDGIAETKWPRLRLVRQASAAEVRRLEQEAREENDDAQAQAVASPMRAGEGLSEVVWLVVPASTTDKNARAEGVVWRGERLLTDSGSKSFFAPDFFGHSNRPPAGATDEVGGGCLWLGVLLATQTSVVHDGWKTGPDLDCAATSWDAWARARPDAQAHPWNVPGAGMPAVRARPVLPRRVRFELELERESDRVRRTALAAPVEVGDSALLVDDGQKVPREEGAFVLVDAEWMLVTGVDGRNVTVQRAQRGTRLAEHPLGAMVHYGQRLVREVPVATYREDWNL